MGLKRVLLILSSYLFLTQVAQGNLTDFDCVDVYKQPAFQHPLLKHHKIPEKFSFDEGLDNKNKYKTNYQSCPKGTIPILRHKNETANVHINTSEYPGQHFATVETVLNGKIYRGAQADISIHNLNIQNNQYSKSAFWLENGPRNEVNSIQVGWAIHPRIYDDSSPRFTIYWTADGYTRTGCYNTKCPGFVLLSRAPRLGMKFDKETMFFTPLVFQDYYTGHWTLKAFDEVIGYWPKELFTHLDEGASLVRFGGNTFLSPDRISPPMGNGQFPTTDFSKSAHHAHVKVMNSKYELVVIEDKMIRNYADCEQCYKLSYWGYTKTNGVSFSFGGPGGNCGI